MILLDPSNIYLRNFVIKQWGPLSYRVQFPFSKGDQYEYEASFITPGTSSLWLIYAVAGKGAQSWLAGNMVNRKPVNRFFGSGEV